MPEPACPPAVALPSVPGASHDAGQRGPRHAAAASPAVIDRRRFLKLAGGGAVAAAVLSTAGIGAAGCSAGHTAASSPHPVTHSTALRSSATCPLTGAPAPGGKVPQRPALAVKVDNYPAARPQSGLDKADIVVEEPVEGLITRYVAIFQCHETSLVGPIRSARAIDVGILSDFDNPLFAHVGGIKPVLRLVHRSSLIDLDLGFGTAASAIQNVPGRQAPYDTYASSAALWGLRPDDTTPPQPVFTYSPSVPPGRPTKTIAIPFSSYANVRWRYSPAQATWLRSYGSSPDLLADGTQASAANVVVQTVDVSYGPWVENSEGGLEVQANLTGSGPVSVFRNGTEVSGTWQRSSLSAPTQLLDNAGHPIALQPGTTWVELVPSTEQWTPGPASGSV